MVSRREQARRWRERAAQLRSAANQVRDTEARAKLRQLANTYEDMARRQEQAPPPRSGGKPSPEES
jgi:hypothetical protein